MYFRLRAEYIQNLKQNSLPLFFKIFVKRMTTAVFAKCYMDPSIFLGTHGLRGFIIFGIVLGGLLKNLLGTHGCSTILKPAITVDCLGFF
jgi:hypothetical protein